MGHALRRSRFQGDTASEHFPSDRAIWQRTDCVQSSRSFSLSRMRAHHVVEDRIGSPIGTSSGWRARRWRVVWALLGFACAGRRPRLHGGFSSPFVGYFISKMHVIERSCGCGLVCSCRGRSSDARERMCVRARHATSKLRLLPHHRSLCM